MKKCGPECQPVCDFCIHYDFNGDKEGRYTGEGYCRYHKEPSDPHHDCDDFYCFRALREGRHG